MIAVLTVSLRQKKSSVLMPTVGH